MTQTHSTKRALVASLLILSLCFASLIGTTFAWFTDSVTSANNIIKSGNLDIELEYAVFNDDGTFKEWKDVKDASDILTNTLWEPGATEIAYIRVANAGSLALKYQLGINVFSEKEGMNTADEAIRLSSYLEFNVEPITVDTNGAPVMYEEREDAAPAPEAKKLFEGYVNSSYLESGKEAYLALVVYMPTSVGNEANYKASDDPNDPYKYQPVINLGVNVLATQYAYEKDSFDEFYDIDATYWEGLADTAWYNEEATTFTLSTPQQIAGLSKLVDEGENFEGKTIVLNADIDLAGHQFNPIGSYRKDKAFVGTFDGQNHTIANMSQNTWALDNGYYYGDLGLGLFGAVEDATIKNLVMDNASISGESALVGIVAGTAYGDCTFENITVKNSKGNDYQYYAGGVVGWASGDQIYKNINIDESTIIGSQWGDFGNANGGIIGGAGTSGTYHFEDCTVACRIDATNDIVSAYQWYNYRNSGMLIGRIGHTKTNDAVTNVDAPNVTCTNVTVIYNDWANYTYCEFAGTGYPYVRVQAGVSVDGYSNVRYGHPTDANGNIVVDDNHVHNDGEDHHLLIVFDQLFGGPADHRYCQYGISEHPGVTVIYNNK